MNDQTTVGGAVALNDLLGEEIEMKELRQLARLMREWTETRGPAPAHKVKDWADAIVAACEPVAWGAQRELTIEEVRAEKALFHVYNRSARARTPFKAWLARATIATNHEDVTPNAELSRVAASEETK